MKYLSSNGREESRTNKGRTSKLTFAYILAAFFLSFGLMFAGSVTSYAAGEDELNNTNNNEQNIQNQNNTNNNDQNNQNLNNNNDQSNQNLNNTNNDQSNQNQNNTNNNDQSNQNQNNTNNNDQSNQNQNNTNNNNQSNQNQNNNNNDQNNQNQNNVNNNNQSNENQNNINNNDQNNVQQSAPAPKITFAWDTTAESGATVSDGTEGTGRLAGYTTTVNHYTSTTGDDIITIVLHTNDDSNITLKEEDFDLSGIGEGYTVEYDLDCGKINIVKVKEASTTVYYEFTEVHEIDTTKVNEYYFVPYTYNALTDENAMIGVPTGTARLSTSSENLPTGEGYTVRSYDTATYGTSNSFAHGQLAGKNISKGDEINNVYVLEKGTGFDGCRVGALYQLDWGEGKSYTVTTNDVTYEINGLMGYWCGYAGAKAFSSNIFGRVYTYLKTEVTADSLTAKAKKGAFDNVGLEGLELSDKDIATYLDVSLKIGNEDYLVGGCTVEDGTLDYLNGDDTISIRFGNTIKTIKVDLSSLGKKDWLNRPAYVAYEDTYDGPEEVYPVFLPKKEVKKEEPVVVETKTEHNTKKHSTENGSSKKTTDDSKLRKENDNALEKIFNNPTKKENEKTDVLAMLEKTVDQIASSITETAKATFGNGAILINVQSWLANTESGEGMWTDSSARNKNLAANQSQVSYTLENADRLAASVLTTSELNSVNNGDTMEIRLRINPNEEKVSQEHKNQFDDAMVAVQDSFAGLTKGEYLDISLEKRRNNGAWQYIPETEDAVRIAIDVPANLVQSGRTFFIIRNHDGECTILRDLDDNDETLTIETDRFSDYLVIYDDNFAESAKNAASGTLYGSAAGTTPTYNNGNTNVVMYVVTFLAILFMVIVVISMRRRDEER